MQKYHAVMLDETRCEFGVDFESDNPMEYLAENYPESRCVQLETPEQSAARESVMHDHISRGGDYDDDGRPIYHYGDEDEDEDWEDDEFYEQEGA